MRQRLEPAPRASRTVLIRRTLSILFPPRDFAGLQHPLSCVCDRGTTASSTVDCWAHLAGLVESLLSKPSFLVHTLFLCHMNNMALLAKGARPLHRGERLQVDCISSRRYNIRIDENQLQHVNLGGLNLSTNLKPQSQCPH